MDNTWTLFPRKPNIQLPAIISTFETSCRDSPWRRYDTGNSTQLNLCCTGCTFAPDDATIISTTAIFPHHNQHEQENDLTVNPPCAFISIWEIDSDDHEAEDCGCMFTYSARPSPQFSPCGNILGAVMNGYQGRICLIGYEMEDCVKNFKSVSIDCVGGNLCGRTQCCVFSPTKNRAATINDLYIGGQDLSSYELNIWRVKDTRHMKSIWSVKLHTLYAGLNGKLRDAKFSQNGELLAVLSTSGQLCVIDIRSRKQKHVIDDIIQNEYQGTVRSKVINCFDFDPRFNERLIAIGCDNMVQILDIAKLVVHCYSILLPEASRNCNHISFSKCGRMLAASCCNGTVYIYNTVKQNLLHTLSFSATEADVESSCCLSSSFSSSSEEIVVASQSGFVHVWQLPRMLGLKEICRLKVRASFDVSTIQYLDIPKSLVNFLLFSPVL